MPDVLAKQTALAVNQVFRSRVQMAMVTAAKMIQGEAKGAQSEIVWQKRQQLSGRVLNQAQAYVDRFAWAVAANTAITTATPSAVSSSTAAAPSVVTTAQAHNLAAGDTVEIVDHVVNTRINGGWIVFSTPTSTTFTVPTAGSGAGTATGIVVKHPTDQAIHDEVAAVWNDIAEVTGSDS